MRNATLIATALLCAYLFTAGTASAQPAEQAMHDGQYLDKNKAVPVAGFSPNFADQQPKTGPELKATLGEDANRLIRWQGWLDVDAFSASVLEQMQMQLGSGIEVGKFTLAEPEIAAAVKKAHENDRSFRMNENLSEDKEGADLKDVKLYVWTYRHNFTDTGLYQLYVSVKGKVLIGRGFSPIPPEPPKPVPHKDIQGLAYEFSPNPVDGGGSGGIVETDIFAEVEIWRGVVVRVDATGAIQRTGNENIAGVVTPGGGVKEAPISAWERAPSLIDNPHYDPKAATGAGFVEPLDREKSIGENKVQKTPGSVQKEGRVRTTNPYRYRSR